MGLALRLYEQLTETTDERVRLRLIADAIGELEESWPRPGEVARSGDVRESELRLQKEIEVVRKEIKEVELPKQEPFSALKSDPETFEANMRAEFRLQRIETVVAVGVIFTLDWIVGRLLT